MASFIPKLISNQTNAIKKQTFTQAVPQTIWIINRQIFSNINLTVIVNGKELSEKFNDTDAGDFYSVITNNTITLYFNTEQIGICEITSVDNSTIDTPTTTNLVPFVDTDLYILTRNHNEQTTFSYMTTTGTTFVLNANRLLLPYTVIIDNQNYNVFVISKDEILSTTHGILLLTDINKSYILLNTKHDILNGKKMHIKRLTTKIYIDKTNLFVENNESIDLFVHFQ